MLSNRAHDFLYMAADSPTLKTLHRWILDFCAAAAAAAAGMPGI